MVHRREIDGEELVFGNQGDLYQNAMTWFDHATGSVWAQPTGEAIMGPRTGDRLDLLPSSLTTWAEWQERFPDTVALDAFTRDTLFSIEQMAVVAVVGDDSVAVPIRELRDARLVEAELDGVPVAIVLDPRIDRWAAYSLDHEGDVLELTVDGEDLVDTASGDRWGAALGTSSTGAAPLDRVSVFSAFPEDYVRIFPEGQVFIDGRFWSTDVFSGRCTGTSAAPSGCRTDG